MAWVCLSITKHGGNCKRNEGVSLDCDLLFARSNASLRANIANTLRGINCLHAFGSNSAESEPIWMKSGKVWAKCVCVCVEGWPWQILGAICVVATVWEGSFFLKTQKLLTKFPGLPGIETSDRHISAVRSDYRSPEIHFQMVPLPLPLSLVFIFTVRSNSESFPGIYVSHKKGTYPNIRQRPMSDIAY